jgi:hypothetical protein
LLHAASSFVSIVVRSFLRSSQAASTLQPGSLHLLGGPGSRDDAPTTTFLCRQHCFELRLHLCKSFEESSSVFNAFNCSAVSTGYTGVGLGRVNQVCVCYRVLGTAS